MPWGSYPVHRTLSTLLFELENRIYCQFHVPNVNLHTMIKNVERRTFTFKQIWDSKLELFGRNQIKCIPWKFQQSAVPNAIYT